MRIEDFYDNTGSKPGKESLVRGHFDLLRVEDLMPGSKSVGFLRRMYYKVSLVYGHSKIRYPEQTFGIKGAALVFTHPNRLYQWDQLGLKQSGHICLFTKAFLNGLIDPDNFQVYQSLSDSVLLLSPVQQSKLETKFEEMKEELNGPYIRKYELLKLMLASLIYYGDKNCASPEVHHTASNANERIVKMFFQQLEQQFPIVNGARQMMLSSPGQFVKKIGIHVNHLNKSLRLLTAKSTSELIHERFMTEAKALLKTTDWPISEIGWLLGFEESNHFSSFFRHHHGLSPSKFRMMD